VDQLDPLGEGEPPGPAPWRRVHHPKPRATRVLDRIGHVRVAWPERMWPDAGPEVPDQRPSTWAQHTADLGQAGGRVSQWCINRMLTTSWRADQAASLSSRPSGVRTSATSGAGHRILQRGVAA
jgi:hypothetical protein